MFKLDFEDIDVENADDEVFSEELQNRYMKLFGTVDPDGSGLTGSKALTGSKSGNKTRIRKSYSHDSIHISNRIYSRLRI